MKFIFVGILMLSLAAQAATGNKMPASSDNKEATLIECDPANSDQVVITVRGGKKGANSLSPEQAARRAYKQCFLPNNPVVQQSRKAAFDAIALEHSWDEAQVRQACGDIKNLDAKTQKSGLQIFILTSSSSDRPSIEPLGSTGNLVARFKGKSQVILRDPIYCFTGGVADNSGITAASTFELSVEQSYQFPVVESKGRDEQVLQFTVKLLGRREFKVVN